jgi:hypothetical protein
LYCSVERHARIQLNPKKIERLREQQTALLDKLENLMMQRFVGEPEQRGADSDPLDDIATMWPIANAAVAKAREELHIPGVYDRKGGRLIPGNFCDLEAFELGLTIAAPAIACWQR